MKNFMQKRWTKYYQSSHKNHYLHLTADSLLAIIILSLLVANTYLSINNSGHVLGTQTNNDDVNTITTLNNEPLINNNPETATSSLDQVLAEKPLSLKPTNLKFQSLARYYTLDGDQLGVGPLPPMVGQTTNYWLFISLADFSHNLENVIISAQLPNHVTWTGKSSVSYGEDISVNTNSGEVRWNLGNLASNDESLVIGLAFEVKLTPVENQIGSPAPLLTNIKISALDTIVKQIIIKNNPTITSQLSGNVSNNTDGAVIAQ